MARRRAVYPAPHLERGTGRPVPVKAAPAARTNPLFFPSMTPASGPIEAISGRTEPVCPAEVPDNPPGVELVSSSRPPPFSQAYLDVARRGRMQYLSAPSSRHCSGKRPVFRKCSADFGRRDRQCFRHALQPPSFPWPRSSATPARIRRTVGHQGPASRAPCRRDAWSRGASRSGVKRAV
jgi:hypothetical protein